MLEKEILRSFIEYPDLIDEFLDKISLKAFSNEALYYLKIINELKDKKLLSLSVFLENVPRAKQSEDFFIELISANVNPLVCDLIPLLVKKYQLEMQEKIAQKLLSGVNANEVLELDLLSKEMEIENKSIKNLNEWLKYYENKPKLAKTPTNLSFIDNAFNGGFELGQLMLISGDAEAGKTTLALQILENISKSKKVAFFSFEFSVDSYLKSVEEQKKKLIKDHIFIINDGYDINEIVANIKRLYKLGVRFFLIDSQMRIEVNSKGFSNMEEKESFKFSSLAKLCHSLEIFIMLIIQTSKTDKDSPTGSKKGEHEASIILRIEKNPPDKRDYSQKESEFDEFSRSLILKKNKQNGKHFKGKIAFNPATRLFSDYESKVKKTEYVDMDDIQKELKTNLDVDIF
ncbi:hypothetical protein DMB92_05305 [Campylobacter sp. MIT 99-7217]|uniref:DnaB-like helicase C-terminal domain-containing protein n=1 Tax=Campylobacter sp. MIT 99-7217 TaxID=535091 RepID=UPI0011574315|nr:DnaB-like helicase C-terminal domain-containing protein [Campylobacter sp. MIT 99-7217]TQR31806.1 hypothetical protein DMB92_05305 [Campylobacter sp. MIT 99-7217]